MREKVFRKPTVRELFEISGLRIVGKIDSKFILDLINSGLFVVANTDYKSAVETVENLVDEEISKGAERKFVLFPGRFRVYKQDSDYGIKSLEDLVKIDSQDTLRTVSKRNDVPARMTLGFLESYKILPYILIKEAMKKANIENPPIGFYWLGADNRARVVTWLRATTGAEMMIMKRKGDFSGEVVDKKPYGRNLRVKVNSRTEEEKIYEFTLSRLPMHSKNDQRQYSDWINISHNSSDPDASYRGEEHEKRAFPLCVWSAPAIFSFYNAMSFVAAHPEWKQFRINPFPIPACEKAIDFIDYLRLKSFILTRDKASGNLILDVLNKAEIEKIIGARTVLRGYENCWHHWGKKDLSYLYKPINK